MFSSSFYHSLSQNDTSDEVWFMVFIVSDVGVLMLFVSIWFCWS